MPDKY